MSRLGSLICRTAGVVDFGFPHVVYAAAEREIARRGGPTNGPGNEMVKLKVATIITSYPVLPDEGATTVIPVPDFPANRGRNVA